MCGPADDGVERERAPAAEAPRPRRPIDCTSSVPLSLALSAYAAANNFFSSCRCEERKSLSDFMSAPRSASHAAIVQRYLDSPDDMVESRPLPRNNSKRRRFTPPFFREAKCSSRHSSAVADACDIMRRRVSYTMRPMRRRRHRRRCEASTTVAQAARKQKHARRAYTYMDVFICFRSVRDARHKR